MLLYFQAKLDKNQKSVQDMVLVFNYNNAVEIQLAEKHSEQKG